VKKLRSLRPLRFLLATGVAATLVLSAPFVGQIRGAVRRAFPEQYLLILGGAAALGLALAVAAAAWRIRDRRMARYGAIALAILIAAVYSLATATQFPERNAVERFHFLQYGLITFLFYRAWRPLEDASVLVLPVLAGLIVGSVEEWFQWFIPNRVGELNDVLLNLVAIISGLLFSLGVDPPRGLGRSVAPGSRRRIAHLAIVTLLTFAAFVHVVHLGSVIEDAEIGTFTSRFSVERLLALQAERSATWAHTPPPTLLVRLSREDQYLSEGLEHVRARNELWTAGDVRAAWLENRILEKYYRPVLDTPTHAGPGQRWPDAQRLDAEQRRAAGVFVSDAYPYRIFPWPPVGFWTAVLLLAAGMFLAQRTFSRR
jgi:VanZ family protein